MGCHRPWLYLPVLPAPEEYLPVGLMGLKEFELEARDADDLVGLNISDSAISISASALLP